MWIYRQYLAPSLNFFLAINAITKHVLTIMEAMATKMLNKWLNLPRNATSAILYHPSLLNCPQVSYLYLKASLGYLAALETSNSTITSYYHCWIPRNQTILLVFHPSVSTS